MTKFTGKCQMLSGALENNFVQRIRSPLRVFILMSIYNAIIKN